MLSRRRFLSSLAGVFGLGALVATPSAIEAQWPEDPLSFPEQEPGLKLCRCPGKHYSAALFMPQGMFGICKNRGGMHFIARAPLLGHHPNRIYRDELPSSLDNILDPRFT